jgi:hypothetical protein
MDGITVQRNLFRANNRWSFTENPPTNATGDFIVRLLVTPDTIFEDGFDA